MIQCAYVREEEVVQNATCQATIINEDDASIRRLVVAMLVEKETGRSTDVVPGLESEILLQDSTDSVISKIFEHNFRDYDDHKILSNKDSNKGLIECEDEDIDGFGLLKKTKKKGWKRLEKGDRVGLL